MVNQEAEVDFDVVIVGSEMGSRGGVVSVCVCDYVYVCVWVCVCAGLCVCVCVCVRVSACAVTYTHHRDAENVPKRAWRLFLDNTNSCL